MHDLHQKEVDRALGGMHHAIRAEAIRITSVGS